MKLEKLHPDSFSWQNWRAGRIADLGIPCRRECIINEGKILIKYAVGYLEGEKLLCRPKNENMAVMFLKDDDFFWFHLRNDEFIEVFGEMI